MISTLWTCDYCGREIFAPYYARVKITGLGVDLETDEDTDLKEEHHYHSGEADSCYRKVMDALDLTEDAGPSLETIPTISGQAVAARRRKHHKPDDRGRG
jgi:hypothetical protein